MEYDARKTDPQSNWNFLVGQLNKQSDLCDVTVKMGLWEKKFHRRVLVISPFFDRVLSDHFMERQTGTVKIAIGTPVALETTIMFLYGRKPKLNDGNIENILSMSEFLLIPNLKSACIAWLKNVSITRENCMKFLQLSSIYDFEIPGCTTFIKEHLPEMLLLQQMINLTKDSVHLLFSDTRLSYVQMDEKLVFLLKWLDANPNTRRIHMKELLSNIDFNSISNQCMQVCLKNPDTACHIQTKHMTTAGSNDHRVLIMKEGNFDDVFWCLDLERDQWFRVESNSLKEKGSNRIVELYGTCTKAAGSIICSVKIGYQEISLVLLDLPMDTCTKMNFRGSKGEAFYIKQSDTIKIKRHMCFVSVNKNIKRKQNSINDSDLTDIQHKLGLMSLTGVSAPNQLLALQMKEKRRTMPYEYTCITSSTLYIGHISKSNVDLTPLFSFKDDEILKFAISEKALAIIFKSRKCVAIYDRTEGHLERKSQTTSYSDEIVQIKDGFVIYDNKRCIFLTRMQGARPSIKYQVEEIPLEQSNFQQLKYFICGQMIYRYYRIELKFRENFIFECTPVQTLLSRKSKECIKWIELPLPKTTLCSRDTIKEKCFEIYLPKSILRCHVECPHCKKPSRLEASRQYKLSRF